MTESVNCDDLGEKENPRDRVRSLTNTWWISDDSDFGNIPATPPLLLLQININEGLHLLPLFHCHIQHYFYGNLHVLLCSGSFQSKMKIRFFHLNFLLKYCFFDGKKAKKQEIHNNTNKTLNQASNTSYLQVYGDK